MTTQTNTHTLMVDTTRPALIALVGAAGAGKSRIARAFPADWRLELDALRWQITGSSGDQSATPAAVAVFRMLLEARLQRRLPTLVDSTNSMPDHRAYLLRHARTWQMPTVAILVSTPLTTCLARQADRPKPKQVPEEAIVRQHAGVPSAEELRAEGWGRVVDAADLDLMQMLLARSAAADLDPLADVRATFGDDLAAVFTFDRDSYGHTDYSQGTFAVADRELVVRWCDDGEPYGHHWQARIDSPGCCPGPAWTKVTTATDLLDAYTGQPLEDLWCSCLDTESPTSFDID